MTTIQDVLRELDVPFKSEGEHKNVRQGWIGCECPRCSSASGFLLGIELDGHRCSCWQCGWMPLEAALAELSGRTRREVRELLGDREDAGERATRDDRRGRLRLPRGLGPLLPAHRKYLRQRGFEDTGALERLWGLQGIGVSGRLGWRIFIPVTLDGKTVSWTTRAIGDAAARYISASPEEEIVSHRRLLFGEDHARHAIVIVEGPFDAFRVGPGAVATLGVGFNQFQVERMARYPVRAICYDNEPSARRRARELADLLGVFPGETTVVTLDAKDAGEASDGEIRRLRRWFLK
jgi:hypothetical protein